MSYNFFVSIKTEHKEKFGCFIHNEDSLGAGGSLRANVNLLDKETGRYAALKSHQ